MTRPDVVTTIRISITSGDKSCASEVEVPYHRIFRDEVFLVLIERLRYDLQHLIDDDLAVRI